eukprot:6347499-Amphidinium_carterae.1
MMRCASDGSLGCWHLLRHSPHSGHHSGHHSGAFMCIDGDDLMPGVLVLGLACAWRWQSVWFRSSLSFMSGVLVFGLTTTCWSDQVTVAFKTWWV